MSGSWYLVSFGKWQIDLFGGLFKWTSSEFGLLRKEHHARLIQGFVKLTESEQQVHLQLRLHLEFRVQCLATVFLCLVCSIS